MKRLKLLDGTEQVACNANNWITNLSKVKEPYAYGEIKKLAFFSEECIADRKDFWNVKDGINLL